MAPIGAIFGGPLGGWISDHWGRKCGLMFSSVPYLIGYLLLGYAHFSPTANLFKTLLLLGRFFSGIGMGWASTTSAVRQTSEWMSIYNIVFNIYLTLQVYIGEVSSASLRGLFGTIMQLNLTMGVLLCYALSISFPYYHIALAAVMIVTIYVMLGFWLKETPKWLLANSNPNIARQTLKWFRGPKYDVLGELEIMRKSLDEDNKTAAWREFKKKPVLIPFVTLLLVFFFQQIGGLNALGAYASVNFRYAGVSHPQLVSTLSLGVSAVVANIIASVIVDRMGRKPLLVISGIGMGIGSTLLGVHFYITRPSLCSEGGGSGFSGDVGDTTLEETGNGSCNEQYGPLAIVSILIYNSLFSIGWAAIPWVLLPELLPLKVRGIGGGFAILVNWATSALVTGAYLNYAEAISLWFAWWSFALLNFSAAAFAFFALVETKGKKLEAIQDAFKNKWKL